MSSPTGSSARRTTQQQQNPDRPRKLQRISQACDLCHRRSIRCRPSTEEADRCQNCYDFDVACTYERPSKRKKHPHAPTAPHQSTHASPASSGSRATGPGAQQPSTSAASHPSTGATSAGSSVEATDTTNKNNEQRSGTASAAMIIQSDHPDQVSMAWRSFALSCESTVNDLLDLYMEIVYPIAPLFHQATLEKRLYNRDQLVDRGFFASIMSACALVSARIRDGAIPRSQVPNMPMQVSSEIFFAAARDAMAKDMTKNEGFDYLRACTLLALTSIQYGQLGFMQQYMGQFFTLASMQRFYDERYWKSGLSRVQIELRRRIYWCTYTLDVFSAATWNCFLRSQEIHTNVRYPSDLDEEHVSNKGVPEGQPQKESWLVGFNFSLDLYRILEHSISKTRGKRFQHEDRRSVANLVFVDSFSDVDVMRTILDMYYQLPSIFKETPPVTGRVREDIYGYQAANIQATLQLVRMILFSMEDGPGVERKCEVASEVLSVFHSIPRQYLRAISTPMIYQLGSIGQVLASAIDEPLTENQLQRVRSSLLSMADLLENLESGHQRAAGASQALRQEVENMDNVMSSRRQTNMPHHIGMHPGGHQSASSQNMLGEAPQMNALPSDDTFDPITFPGMQSEFQIPPELMGDWTWPPDMGSFGSMQY